ncbi:MAG TPA: choice-of-anchor tandem repeat GloVer-containing protein [Candidatus Sulfotelmatobacter sp.]|nr:choice-of-anchor tandem repeat GloVer-containing protein [Candidatus Sulfotelmatobacter sp.]
MLRVKILCGYLCFALLCSLTLAIPSAAQTYRILFNSNDTEADFPLGSLVQGPDGNFYGTTLFGGTSTAFPGGTIFRITPQGALTTLYNFCSQDRCADGALPAAGLALGTDGNLYGTTEGGGPNGGGGTVFRITPQGMPTILASFSSCTPSNCPDGIAPITGLVLGSGGNFLGTTSDVSTSRLPSHGTIFRITPQGALTTLYHFCSLANCADGSQPSGLIQATDGNFYGTTGFSGQLQFFSLNGNGAPPVTGMPGTVFRITPAGFLTTIHTFCQQTNCTDGSLPSGLIQASDGNLYGTTDSGGSGGNGVIFRIALNGAFTKLYDFCSQANCADGGQPLAGLIQGTDGNFYCTTTVGGTRTGGTLFRMTPAGAITVLHSFANQHEALAAPFQATDGRFYGTLEVFGFPLPAPAGIIYRESVGLAPFVETVQKVGQVGSTIIILGTNLTGATAVSFNGTAATFTVVSPTEIKAKVPTGATTGQIQVTTPTGVLTSNVAFRVP